ncbi:putative amidohydrolase [Hoeflea phototrophica DFL-43]|jgi:predicted amidohydrolase|uniref:Putative amidohydrolase n=1 Tax=Hoeflea phototrophica (strain DSM 17068 / NCIMB 14078 / DFL-43) TaxID=411684 RepID=A9D7R7_HOEPD|nr:carbon-nitrogen hydrolase family protein [Hoeflea phototrophica]EDQ33128.1 putative amidohydrolase [Hoeflea phototrophica DFL-43]
MSELVVAAIQMRSGVQPAANIAVMEALVRKAAARGALYVQTPEMTGAVQRDRKALQQILKTEAEDEVLAAASSMARELKIYLHIGSTAVEAGDGMAANRGVVFDPNGEKLAHYDKIHMFDVDLDSGESWRESAVYQPGEFARTVDIDGARLGMGICYDIRFPRLFRDLALAGADILTAPAAFTRQTGEAHWHVLQRARAIENGAFVVSAAQGGVHEDGRETYGHSIIVDPWGRVIAEAEGDEPGFIAASLEIDEVKAARGKIPNLKNARSYQVAAQGVEKVERVA